MVQLCSLLSVIKDRPHTTTASEARGFRKSQSSIGAVPGTGAIRSPQQCELDFGSFLHEL